jgi:hypothetical protein
MSQEEGTGPRALLKSAKHIVLTELAKSFRKDVRERIIAPHLRQKLPVMRAEAKQRHAVKAAEVHTKGEGKKNLDYFKALSFKPKPKEDLKKREREVSREEPREEKAKRPKIETKEELTDVDISEAVETETKAKKGKAKKIDKKRKGEERTMEDERRPVKTKRRKIAIEWSDDDDDDDDIPLALTSEPAPPSTQAKTERAMSRDLDSLFASAAATPTPADTRAPSPEIDTPVLSPTPEIPEESTPTPTKKKGKAVAKPKKAPAKAVAKKKEPPTPAPLTIPKTPKRKGKASAQSTITPTTADDTKLLSPPPSPTFDFSELGISQQAVDDWDEDLYYLKLALMSREEVPDMIASLPTPSPEPEEKTENRPYRVHITGSARTEGYYKIPHEAKGAFVAQYSSNASAQGASMRAKHAQAQAGPEPVDAAPVEEPKEDKKKVSSRSARANNRRLAQGMEEINQLNLALALSVSNGQEQAPQDSTALKWNQLHSRHKNLKFARSPIHSWGLYAMERIPKGDMVIEYIGEVVRAQVAEKREKAYERQGIGSSYLFRIDDEHIVDATKRGNLGCVLSSAILVTVG